MALDLNPADTLAEVVQVHRWALTELLALAAAADNDSARVGAIRSRVAISTDLLGLLQAAGAVPTGSIAFQQRVQQETRLYLSAALDVMADRGLNYDELEAEVFAIVDGHEAVAA